MCKVKCHPKVKYVQIKKYATLFRIFRRRYLLRPQGLEIDYEGAKVFYCYIMSYFSVLDYQWINMFILMLTTQ